MSISELFNKDTEEKPIPADNQDWGTKLCTLIEDEWNRGQQYVEEPNRVYEDIYKMIRGERPEKNYDWQSNVVINKVFQVVWTAIPYIIQKIFGATPIIGVKSFDQKGAWQREEILEFWHTMQPAKNGNQISYFLIVTMWLLRALLNGVGILKKTWHQKLKKKSITIHIPMALDKNGNVTDTKEITQTLTIPIEDWPSNIIVNNKDIVVDWLLQPGQSIRNGRFIIHREMTDLESLYSSKIKYMNLDKINPKVSTADSTLRQDHSDLTGMDQQNSTPDSDVYADVEIYERQGIFPVYRKKQDGHWMPCFDKEKIYDSVDVVMKEMVIVYAKAQENVLIRFDENPYGEKGYVDLHIYLDAERWQSMGMIEPFKDVQTALNDNINAAFDEIWQNLMPPTVFNKFALWDWDTVQFAPGQKWMVGGSPTDSVMFKEPSHITRDAWQKHMLLDSEIQLTSSIMPPMQGAGKEKAATTNVLNAQMSAGKLDFLVKMIEITGLIPSAQMDIRFSRKFAHPKTFEMILGEPFQFAEIEEIYRYIPAAASVKLEYQRDQETMQDIQLIGVLANIPNPNVPKILNVFLQNILRNRNMPQQAALLDEDYFEPQSDAGNMKMLDRMMGGNVPSNQANLPMTTPEKGVRRLSSGGEQR